MLLVTLATRPIVFIEKNDSDVNYSGKGVKSCVEVEDGVKCAQLIVDATCKKWKQISKSFLTCDGNE